MSACTPDIATPLLLPERPATPEDLANLLGLGPGRAIMTVPAPAPHPVAAPFLDAKVEVPAANAPSAPVPEVVR